ncbi:MAG: aspartate dehydrogenase [Candidatus Omnitrophica bacterium]|nr:aspartate dehydrogenase [Candidatus Omnitrophota bacterium]MCM8790510.1 aspartate dehydrogenase [Candidatus Omnitrophota bacterium]
MKKIKVGIIGCGAIGTEIAKACRGRLAASVELVAICDISRQKAEKLLGSVGADISVMDVDGLVNASDVIVESASAAVSAVILEKCINNGKDCLVMSVGGLIGKEELLKRAAAKGIKVYIPSGAICGIDGLKSASVGRIESVVLTTRKPPKGLEGAPYLIEKGVDLGKIKKETVLFEGSAQEAVKGFPANVNVSAVLSLAGLGSAKTRVRIVTSPDYTKNTHEIEITGDCGKIMTRTDNVPSEVNPKTSALAIFSAIATLESLTTSVRIGT